MTEEQKNEWAAMEDRLMPTSGKAETVAGEIIRAVDRIWYRWYNDGDKINVGYGKETCNGTARFLEKIRGSEFPAEVWNGCLDDDGYTEDSRMDFIDDDLDRDEDEEEEYED